MSQLIAETFRLSHLVLASVTYNLGIYPKMLNFLEDMKALNVQNRTVGLIENGSWAVRSGDLIEAFLNDEMKNITVLEDRVSLASALDNTQAIDLDRLADAISDDMQKD